MWREDAETIALKALTWLAGDEDMLRHFCSATGIAPEELRRSPEDPAILAGVLDFITLDDAWVTAFAAAEGVEPGSVAQARAALPGGDAPHWT